ncbi:hypothetical protein DFH28DRAFT_973439 [Melampsora americana]|nr:hypothetical protein DFH28DRAFT_973439 [Melampsora americana]
MTLLLLFVQINWFKSILICILFGKSFPFFYLQLIQSIQPKLMSSSSSPLSHFFNQSHPYSINIILIFDSFR